MTSPFDSWAQLSDLLVQSAIAVLALAFLAYAVDLATRRTVLTGPPPSRSSEHSSRTASRRVLRR